MVRAKKSTSLNEPTRILCGLEMFPTLRYPTDQYVSGSGMYELEWEQKDPEGFDTETPEITGQHRESSWSGMAVG